MASVYNALPIRRKRFFAVFVFFYNSVTEEMCIA